MEAGANKDQPRTDNGSTPLHLAVEQGHLDLVRFMLESSANSDTTMEHLAHLASRMGHTELATFLADFRAKSPAKKIRKTK